MMDFIQSLPFGEVMGWHLKRKALHLNGGLLCLTLNN